MTAELETVKKENKDLIKGRDDQNALLRRLQDETEQHVAQLSRSAHDSHGDAVGEPVDVDMLDRSMGAAEGMTIQEIKESLIDLGFEGEVWELASRRTPRVKKADWVALMKRHQ